MPISLSKAKLASYVGDVQAIYLCGEDDLAALPVTWELKGDAVTLRSFSDDPATPFNHGVTVALHAPGTATVTAVCEGERYTCEIEVRERCAADPNGPVQFYRGDLHMHAAATHTPAKYAAQPHLQQPLITQLKEDALLDFGVISDHTSVMRRRGFFDGFVETEQAGEMRFVLFPGSESEVTVLENDRFGLPHKHSGEIVVLNADNCCNAYDWQTFMEDFATSPDPVAIFAHPIPLGVGQNSLWSFPFDKLRTPEMYRIMRGIEMGSGKNNGNALLFEYAYSTALDNGFHVSPTCSSDSHGPRWGFDVIPGKTVLMASERSREAFLDALRQGRFYASESGNVKLRFAVNGAYAPATLPLTDTYEFDVSLDFFEERENTYPVAYQLISDHGVTLSEGGVDGRSLHFTLKSDTARYFYLRLIDSDGRKTWSPAVWTGRELDPPSVAASYTPIAPDGFTAVELATGADASAAIDGDPGVAFTSTLPQTAVVIDMQQEREIAAVGYYVHRFTKDWIKATSVDWKAEISARVGGITSGYVTRYAVSTSVDGEHFTEQASGAIRAFGDEEIIPLPRHRARYVRFDALSTVGAQCGIPAFANAPASFGELSVFE